MVAYGVLGLVLGVRLAAGAFSYAQQRRIEELLFRLGVDFQKCREPRPDGAERPRVGGIDLLENREQPPLLMVVVQNQLGDVDGTSPSG
jgi:hypothetical protein